ncbi:ABC transporter permease [Natrarchaeobaculum aegyptiacum]|uniref:Peptide ABC transporter permease n=1 Tax=Natrarchaeobaculum aegyptiacum TaxID=745377 RepID=A0A2Z2HV72_9EURY|nr:ABC transporter permease [Natrarchaeobaculum aegyptiacum]ARS88934.1 peptide ABC transporter permease [Natrarchaeobaculum aegyptiacum]
MSLGKYVIRRTLYAVPVLFGVTAITFSLLHLVPGDVVDVLVGYESVDPATRADLEAKYGLNQPIWQQYLQWLADALTLEFGESPVTGRDVEATVAQRLPATLALGFAAWAVSLAVGIPVGILAAVRRDRPADEASRLAALAAIATPNFWLGLVLLFVFAVQLGWFRVTPPEAPLFSLEMLRFMVLPTITLSVASAAIVARLLRASMCRELEAEYVRTARAKGLRERTVIGKHVLRNSLAAVVTFAGLQIALLVDGAVVVEQVFSWPGMGQLVVEAIDQRDVPVVQAVVLLIGVSVVVANLLVDVAYAVLDPRVRYDR